MRRGSHFLVGVAFLGMDYYSRISNNSRIPVTVSFSEVAVTRSARFKEALRAKSADHFEVALATIGILVAILASIAALFRGPRDVAMMFVVWFEGMMLWAVCRHCRTGREHLVRKLRVMLQDRVNNQLTVLVGLTDIRSHDHSTSAEQHDDVDLALTAARAVSREIEMLSIESLRSWENRYAKHLPAPLR